MRNLRGKQAERGKFLALAQVFLDINDLLVETRFPDRDPGKFRQRRQDAYFFVRKTVLLRGVNIESAGAFSGEN